MEIKDNKLLIMVTFYGENETTHTTEALIDTGSAFVVMPPELDELLQLEKDVKEPYAKVTTASGVITLQKKIIKKLKIAGLELHNVAAVVHELPEPAPTKVLIGMSLLIKTKLNLDGKNLKFELQDP